MKPSLCLLPSPPRHRHPVEAAQRPTPGLGLFAGAEQGAAGDLDGDSGGATVGCGGKTYGKTADFTMI